MSQILRVAEIIMYSLANFVPYLALTIYVFYHHPRFSRPITTIICIAATLIQIGTRFWGTLAIYGNSVNIILVRLIAYTLLMWLAIRNHIGKILFIELIFSNISSFIMITAVCLENLLFEGQNHRMYCWHTTMIILLLHLILTLPFSITVRKRFRPTVETPPLEREWYYYWLIPGIFYLVWQYLIYGSDSTSAAEIRNPKNVLFLMIVNCGSLLVFYIIIWLNGQLHKNIELERKNHLMDLERLEYQILEERIQEAKKARHDLRHHIIMVEEYLNNQDYDHLKAYLQQYRDSLPEPHALSFCKHRSINSILLHYANQAHDHNIDFEVHLSLPEKIEVSDIDISVLLGNLLENALHACTEQKGTDRRITINGSATKHSLTFTIDNTFDHEIKRDKNGKLITTKKHGSGIGLESAKNIVECYNGIFDTSVQNNMFCVSFMLNL